VFSMNNLEDRINKHSEIIKKLIPKSYIKLQTLKGKEYNKLAEQILANLKKQGFSGNQKPIEKTIDVLEISLEKSIVEMELENGRNVIIVPMGYFKQKQQYDYSELKVISMIEDKKTQELLFNIKEVFSCQIRGVEKLMS